MIHRRQHPISSRIFKAYDVRGVYPGEINEAIAGRIAGALGAHFQKYQISNIKYQKHISKMKIVIGHDARLSSPSLYHAILKTLYPEPYTLVRAGLVTTPMLYFLVNELHAAGGIMVTASHNPKEYNGIKAVGRGAVPISGAEIRRLIAHLTSG